MFKNADERAQATMDKISKANILKVAAEKTRPNKPITIKKKSGNE